MAVDLEKLYQEGTISKELYEEFTQGKGKEEDE